MNNKITNAIIFAANAHSGQFRKGTRIPYITHPVEVMGIVSTITDDIDVIAAAVLHDTVEDSSISVDEIRRNFGERAAELVSAESEDKMTNIPASSSWQIRKRATIDHLSHCNDINVKIIALGDKLSNLRSIKRDLDNVGDKLWDRFNQHDPLMHKWYYSSFLETLNELSDTDAYREYKKLIEICW